MLNDIFSLSSEACRMSLAANVAWNTLQLPINLNIQQIQCQ